MIRVGLDLRPTEPGFKSHFGRGTGRYTGELTRSLMRRYGQGSSPCELVPLAGPSFAGTRLEKLLVKLSPMGRGTLETQLLLPRRMKKFPVDLIHFFSHGDAPARSPVPYVTTVLDLIPLRFPELYKADKPSWRFHLARSLELRSIRASRGIIAISEATKGDLHEILGVPRDQVFVTPLAVSEAFCPGAGAEAGERKQLRLQLEMPADRPLLLYVGGIDPRKNVLFMLEVFSKVLRETVHRPMLALVGTYESDRHYPKLLAKIAELGLGEDVRLLGFVSDEALPSYYRAAEATLFPSLYEGFGLPVLESMACGTPSVAGRNSSIPEVVGAEYPLLEGSDMTAWVRDIDELLSSPAKRDQLRNLGLRRARDFSWDRTAALTLEAYEYFSDGLLPLQRVVG